MADARSAASVFRARQDGSGALADDHYAGEGIGAGAAWSTWGGEDDRDGLSASVDVMLIDELAAREELEDWFTHPASDPDRGFDVATVLAKWQGAQSLEPLDLRSYGAGLFQAPQSGTLPDQLGGAAGFAVSAPLAGAWTLTGAVEGAAVRSAGPVDLARGHFGSRLSLEREAWRFTLGFAGRDRDLGNRLDAAPPDRLAQASMTYSLPWGPVLQVGYRIGEEYSEDRQAFGVGLTWEASAVLK